MEQYGGSIERVASTATAAGTTVLINTSPQIQVFTGTSTQTVQLPSASTYSKAGAKFEIYNRSSGAVAVHYNDTTLLQSIPANSSLIVKCVDNGTSNGTWVTLSNSASAAVTAPTVQRLLSGSGTYTTPVSPAPLYLRVTMVGGGGGGGGPGNPGPTGTAGGNTTFGTSLLVANGGQPGTGSLGTSGPGGTASVSSPAIVLAAVSGSYGDSGMQIPGGNFTVSGSGGTSPFGGAGGGTSHDNDPTAGATNSGSGGGGAGGNASVETASGGASGGYVVAWIPSPSATYSYAVGAAGVGAGGGANGGSGVIIVEEHYQ